VVFHTSFVIKHIIIAEYNVILVPMQISTSYYTSRLKNLTLSLVPPSTVLFVHLIRYQIRPDLPVLDVVAHFFGGFAIAWMGLILMKGLIARREIPEETPHWFKDYCILGTVALAGVAWEFYEWGSDSVFGTVMQFTIPETMNDLLMDMLGGMLFLLIVHILWMMHKNSKT